jgi:hypothetical protein
VTEHKRKPVCCCPLCSEERGEPSEAYWQERYRQEEERCDRECLSPEEIWGMRLIDFARMYDAGEREQAQAALLYELRRQKTWSLDAIADMIDPAGKSYWKLELKQRRRGTPRRLSSDDTEVLIGQYEYRLAELQNERRASPVKTARGELAAEYKMTDEEIRAIIDRAQGKKVRKRATKTKGRKYP